MTRECFAELCSSIIDSIGERAFLSKSYINDFLKGKDNIFMAHEKTSGGYNSGGPKLTITLRILTSGDTCDLGVLFDLHPKTCNEIMLHVLSKWINKKTWRDQYL